MDAKRSESGHLMMITPERVFYAGLLGRPRERCQGADQMCASHDPGNAWRGTRGRISRVHTSWVTSPTTL